MHFALKHRPTPGQLVHYPPHYEMPVRACFDAPWEHSELQKSLSDFHSKRSQNVNL